MNNNKKDIQRVSVDNNKIIIERLDLGVQATTTYLPGYKEFDVLLKEIKSSLWTPTVKGHIKRSHNGRTEFLHQLVYKTFNNERKLKSLYKQGFIIEHIDNNGLNCELENLAILTKRNNTLKGVRFDKLRKKNRDKLRIDIRAGFISGTYQINLTFLNKIRCRINSVEYENLFHLDLKYGNGISYPEVLNDAQRMLDMISKYDVLEISNPDYKFVDYIDNLIQPQKCDYIEKSHVVTEWL